MRHWTLTDSWRTLASFFCVTRPVRLAATRVVCGGPVAVNRRSGGAAARQHHQAELAAGVLGGQP